MLAKERWRFTRVVDTAARCVLSTRRCQYYGTHAPAFQQSFPPCALASSAIDEREPIRTRQRKLLIRRRLRWHKLHVKSDQASLSSQLIAITSLRQAVHHHRHSIARPRKDCSCCDIFTSSTFCISAGFLRQVRRRSTPEHTRSFSVNSVGRFTSKTGG